MVGMTNDQKPLDPISQAVQAFRQAEKWLFTLITDPKGDRYFQEKSMEVRQMEFEDQIIRTQQFLDFCGNPERAFPSIHVAGTSGKGSVVNLISSILAAADYRVGYHVSPYLQVCNEKLVVDGEMIPPSAFVSLVEEFKALYQAWTAQNSTYSALKYGEAWVALTFMWFARSGIDWGVVETGLGGRYDPTNVVPAKLAVITNVNYDHMEVLGEELVQIAGHKAGIIKSGGLAVTAETNPETLAVIRQEAELKGATLYVLGEDFDYSIEKQDDVTFLHVNGVFQNYHDLRIAMMGDFQYENAALAVASLDVLAGHREITLSETQVAAGLQIEVPGRFEVVQRDPMVILDGAHNLPKATALANSLKHAFPGQKMTVVLGTLTIKDFSGIIEVLAPMVRRWVATEPKVFGKPAAPTSALVKQIRAVTPDVEVLEAPDVQDAIDLALAYEGTDGLVLVTGSLYLLGAARSRWVSADEILRKSEEAYQSSRSSTNLR